MTAPAPAPPKQREDKPEPRKLKVGPAKGMTAGEYLEERGWFPLGDPASDECLWYEPNFSLIESYETVKEPMSNEVARHARDTDLHRRGIMVDPVKDMIMKTQIRVHPAAVPLFTQHAYRTQVTQELAAAQKAELDKQRARIEQEKEEARRKAEAQSLAGRRVG